MSNKKRIQKKRQQLKDAAPVDLHNFKVTPDLVEMLKKITEASRKAVLDLSKIKPRQREGMMAIEVDKAGNRKTVFAGSREYKGNS